MHKLNLHIFGGPSINHDGASVKTFARPFSLSGAVEHWRIVRRSGWTVRQNCADTCNMQLLSCPSLTQLGPTCQSGPTCHPHHSQIYTLPISPLSLTPLTHIPGKNREGERRGEEGRREEKKEMRKRRRREAPMLEPCWRSSLASFNTPPPRRRWRRPPRHHLLPQAHGEAPQARSTSTRHPAVSCSRWRFPKSW